MRTTERALVQVLSLTPLDLPLLLFLLSGLVGVWVAYDQRQAWFRFLLIGASVMLCLIISRLNGLRARRREDSLNPALIDLVWFYLAANALLAIYFTTQYDFANGGEKFGAITQLGALIHFIAPQFHLPVPHPNNVAGMLEIALPINVALAWNYFRAHEQRQHITALVLLVIIAFGLMMTASRGTWLAIGAAGLVMALVAQKRIGAKSIAVGLTLIAGLIFVALFSSKPLVQSVIGNVQTVNGEFPRTELYAQIWRLIQDYTFTGSGLASFPMVYSTYALLIQVYFLPHAHNIYLQIWIEQGIVGLGAFVWLIVALYRWVGRQRADINWLVVGGIGATTALLVHGFIDAPLWYSDLTTAFLFFPFGLTAAAINKSQMQTFATIKDAAVAGSLIAIVLVVSMLSIGANRFAAMGFANLGVVSETRMELSRYNFPDTLVEYVRRDADFTESKSLFQQALALDPGNVTANQRLGQLALARSDYASAKDFFLMADARDPSNPVTWQLLGAAYLGLGQIDNAHEYWNRLPNAAQRLESEAWVRYETRGDHDRAKLAYALAARIQAEQRTK